MLDLARLTLAYFELFGGDGRGLACFGQFLPCCTVGATMSRGGNLASPVSFVALSF